MKPRYILRAAWVFAGENLVITKNRRTSRRNGLDISDVLILRWNLAFLQHEVVTVDGRFAGAEWQAEDVYTVARLIEKGYRLMSIEVFCNRVALEERKRKPKRPYVRPSA